MAKVGCGSGVVGVGSIADGRRGVEGCADAVVWWWRREGGVERWKLGFLGGGSGVAARDQEGVGLYMVLSLNYKFAPGSVVPARIFMGIQVI